MVLERDNRVHCSWEDSTDMYGLPGVHVKSQSLQGNQYWRDENEILIGEEMARYIPVLRSGIMASSAVLPRAAEAYSSALPVRERMMLV
jgi:hypothetical protein